MQIFMPLKLQIFQNKYLKMNDIFDKNTLSTINLDQINENIET